MAGGSNLPNSLYLVLDETERNGRLICDDDHDKYIEAFVGNTEPMVLLYHQNKKEALDNLKSSLAEYFDPSTESRSPLMLGFSSERAAGREVKRRRKDGLEEVKMVGIVVSRATCNAAFWVQSVSAALKSVAAEDIATGGVIAISDDIRSFGYFVTGRIPASSIKSIVFYHPKENSKK